MLIDELKRKFLPMKNNSINNQLTKIEEQVNDDMTMYLQFGSAYFSCDELENLYEEWEKHMNRYEKFRNICIFLSTCSLIWVPIALGVLISDLDRLFIYVIALFPVCLASGIAGWIILYARYGRMKYQKSIGKQLIRSIRKKRKWNGFEADDYKIGS